MPSGLILYFCPDPIQLKPLRVVPSDTAPGPVGPDPEYNPETSAWLLPAMVFPGGGGEAVGCTNFLIPTEERGGPDTSPAATCLFSDGASLAFCQVNSEDALCMYSAF
jgi:hypothetical protein